MQVDKGILQVWFLDFNKRYFDGELPTPILAIGNSRTQLGTMSWRQSHKWLKSTYTYTIRISNFYDVEEKDFKNVLLHEMIHLYIESKHLKDTSSHGRLFQTMMQRINSYGWEIKISTKIDCDAKAAKKPKGRWCIVLAISLATNQYLLSIVNPRYVYTIEARLRKSKNVLSFSWYISSNAYFANFPQVRTPRGRIVKKDIYDMVIAKAQPFNFPKKEG